MPSATNGKRKCEEPPSPISLDPSSGRVEASISLTENCQNSPSQLSDDIAPKEKHNVAQVFKCWWTGNCDFTSDNYNTVSIHYITKHTNLPAITCTVPECPTKPTFTHPGDFDSHIAQQHPGIGIICTECNHKGKSKEFSTFAKFKAHFRDHHQSGWQCKHCGAVYRDRKEFVRCLSAHITGKVKRRRRGAPKSAAVEKGKAMAFGKGDEA